MNIGGDRKTGRKKSSKTSGKEKRKRQTIRKRQRTRQIRQSHAYGILLLDECKQTPDVNIEKVGELIEHGADVNIQDEKQSTPLHYACHDFSYDPYDYIADDATMAHVEDGYFRWSKETVLLLLDYGADPNIKDNMKWTPLDYALMDNNTECVDILLYYGANPTNIKYRNPDETPEITRLLDYYLKIEEKKDLKHFNLALLDAPKIAKANLNKTPYILSSTLRNNGFIGDNIRNFLKPK
jgi:ankyrin repeat protein